MMEHALVALVGATGSGKDAVMKATLERFAGALGHYRSITTRGPRPGETKDDYDFTDQAEFTRRVENGELIEWAQVFDHRYGRARAPLEALRRHPMIGDMSPEGIVTFQRHVRETGEFSLRVVRLRGENMQPLRRRVERAAEDAVRALIPIQVDLELVNDHAPGGLVRTIDALEAYIREHGRVVAV